MTYNHENFYGNKAVPKSNSMDSVTLSKVSQAYKLLCSAYESGDLCEQAFEYVENVLGDLEKAEDEQRHFEYGFEAPTDL